MRRSLPLLAFALLVLSPSASFGASPGNQNSCAFINESAFNNQGDCWFSDRKHSSVTITPNRKISSAKAAQWIIDASIALQVGGERNFNQITVLTSPDAKGEYAEAKSTDKATIQQEPATIRMLTRICKSPGDWSDVVGLDGKPGTPHKCRPLK